MGLPPLIFPEFPSFSRWLGRESPGGDTLRTAYLAMHTRSERGVERNVELQGNRAGGDPTSSEHTFATIKNISQPVPGLPPGEPLTAVWDCVDNETGMLLTAVCVTSTAVGEYAHAAHCLKVLRGDTMGTCFMDTWPVGKDVLRVLGDMSGGRLDILPWMKRITKMLRDALCDYGVAPRHALLCGVRLGRGRHGSCRRGAARRDAQRTHQHTDAEIA